MISPDLHNAILTHGRRLFGQRAIRVICTPPTGGSTKGEVELYHEGGFYIAANGPTPQEAAVKLLDVLVDLESSRSLPRRLVESSR